MHRDLPVSNTSEQREPSARLQRPGIKDPKLLMGILLILVSIVGVIAVIQLNNHTTQYYAAKSDIHVGDKITSDMLTPVDAYDKGLVKKIEVHSVQSEDNYNDAYINVLSLERQSKTRSFAKIEVDASDEYGLQRKIIKPSSRS